jgi:predicted DNA-binding antitoxin AbrB/MazE fold protein
MTVHAIFQDGVFKPTQPVALQDGTEVTFDPVVAEAAKGTDLERAIQRIQSRTPQQIEADRQRLLASSRPPRPLPPGKTLADVVVGTWPGDETDEEINAELEKLS